MRAKNIKESLNFEKSKDPLRTLQIGKMFEMEKFFIIIRELIEKGLPDGFGDSWTISDSLLKIYPKLQKRLRSFVSNWKEYLTLLDENGLEIKGTPSLKETTFKLKPDMRAKSVSENINFERGIDPYVKIGIGERTRVLKFLDEVAGDIQFNKDEPEYMGYLNTGIDFFLNDQNKEAFEIFVKKWKEFLPDLRERNLYLLDPPTIDETIFYDEPSIGGINAIKESVNFERGEDPKKSMQIGKTALLKKKDSEIDWDWYPDPTDREEIIDIVEYKGFHIKVSKITDDSGSSFFSVTDYGEPYIDGPEFCETPEDAITPSELFLDEVAEVPEEYLNFDREGSAFDKLNIGKKEILKEKDRNIDWDWRPDSNPEKLIDIIEYKGHPIKIAKILYDKKSNNPLLSYNKFYAVTDTGVWSIPNFFSTPEEALSHIKSYWDDQLMESFERSRGDLEKFQIGHQVVLKKKAQEIDWDWDIHNKEKILDLIKYKNTPIKISQIFDEQNRSIGFVAVTSTDNSITQDELPTFNSPEKALENVKIFLDKWGFTLESLNFERTGSSISKLGVGQKAIDQDIINNTDWHIHPNTYTEQNMKKFRPKIIKLIRDYKGYPILILRVNWDSPKPFIGTSHKGVQGSPSYTAKQAEDDVKRVIDWHEDVKKIEDRKNRRKEQGL